MASNSKLVFPHFKYTFANRSDLSIKRSFDVIIDPFQGVSKINVDHHEYYFNTPRLNAESMNEPEFYGLVRYVIHVNGRELHNCCPMQLVDPETYPTFDPIKKEIVYVKPDVILATNCSFDFANLDYKGKHPEDNELYQTITTDGQTVYYNEPIQQYCEIFMEANDKTDEKDDKWNFSNLNPHTNLSFEFVEKATKRRLILPGLVINSKTYNGQIIPLHVLFMPSMTESVIMDPIAEAFTSTAVFDHVYKDFGTDDDRPLRLKRIVLFTKSEEEVEITAISIPPAHLQALAHPINRNAEVDFEDFHPQLIIGKDHLEKFLDDNDNIMDASYRGGSLWLKKGPFGNIFFSGAVKPDLMRPFPAIKKATLNPSTDPERKIFGLLTLETTDSKQIEVLVDRQLTSNHYYSATEELDEIKLDVYYQDFKYVLWFKVIKQAPGERPALKKWDNVQNVGEIITHKSPYIIGKDAVSQLRRPKGIAKNVDKIKTDYGTYYQGFLKLPDGVNSAKVASIDPKSKDSEVIVVPNFQSTTSHPGLITNHAYSTLSEIGDESLLKYLKNPLFNYAEDMISNPSTDLAAQLASVEIDSDQEFL